jgi:hypothetical protein
MTQLTEIINIQISRETQAVAQTNFNVPLFLATFTNFKERAREYTSTEAVAEDFGVTSNVYIAATKLFGQTLRPAKIVVGRRQVPTVNISVGTVANATLYRMTVSDVVFSYTSDASATAIEIATGLKTAYNAAPVAGVTVTDNLDGTLTVISTVDWSVTVSANLSMTNAASTETYVEALEAVQNVNNKWYALTCESHLKADILALAGAIEAKKKIYGASSDDLDVKTSATDDVASALKAAGYFRTFLIWSADADTQFPECAWVGSQLQEQPGSNTWAYKPLAGITVSSLSDTEASNIKGKNCSTYEVVGGVNRTVGGATSGGEWIDVMVFVDWLEAKMTERIWFRLANSKKIPYTRAGATIIETEVRAQLSEGVRAGGIADDTPYTVITPDVLTISQNSRANRVFEGMKFEARLAGAIHFVKIAGTVTV